MIQIKKVKAKFFSNLKEKANFSMKEKFRSLSAKRIIIEAFEKGFWQDLNLLY